MPLRFPARLLCVVRPRTNSRPALIAVNPAYSSTTRRWRLFPPEYRSVCYGSVHATRIAAVDTSPDDRTTVRFVYQTELEPWGEALAPYLALKTRDERVTVLAPAEDAPNGIGQLMPPTIDFRRVLYPPNGAEWHLPNLRAVSRENVHAIGRGATSAVR